MSIFVKRSRWSQKPAPYRSRVSTPEKIARRMHQVTREEFLLEKRNSDWVEEKFLEGGRGGVVLWGRGIALGVELNDGRCFWRKE